MINEITINSNNTIDLSRGELLNWVNQLLKTNLTKIQQLGTGSIYCQLFDILYPNKIPITKVNSKAKFEYQFVQNFKILQQSFTKMNILKNIQVQKLIKCKYQDNLQFLQWFRKMFQTCGNNKDLVKKTQGDGEKKREKENRGLLNSHNSRDVLNRSNSRTHTEINDRSHLTPSDSFVASQRIDQTFDRSIPSSQIKLPSLHMNPPNSPQINFKAVDNDWKADIKDQAFKEQRQFYLKKFKEIQHLCQEWNKQRSSEQLIQNIRKIILVAPNINWSIQEGEYKEIPISSTSITEQTQLN